MNRSFIEATEFTEWVTEYLTDDQYAAMQQELLLDPEKGDVMPGCGGLRKLRVGDPKRGKGKRGGARAIYLDVPEAGIIFFLDIYGKDDKDDLSPSEKKALKALVEVYKREVSRGARKLRPRRRGPS